MKTIYSCATIASLALLAACGGKPAEAPANTATAAATPAAGAPAPATEDVPANEGDVVVGKWVDDENDTYTFLQDGTITSVGQVSMHGKWVADGEARYAVDLTSPAGLMKGVGCVDGDTMAMRIGDGELTWLGRVGADGKPAAVDKAVSCD